MTRSFLADEHVKRVYITELRGNDYDDPDEVDSRTPPTASRSIGTRSPTGSRTDAGLCGIQPNSLP